MRSIQRPQNEGKSTTDKDWLPGPPAPETRKAQPKCRLKNAQAGMPRAENVSDPSDAVFFSEAWYLQINPAGLADLMCWS
jgi:hypothetical protein